MRKNVELNFKTNYYFIIPESIMRVILFIILYFSIEKTTESQLMEHHIYDFFLIATTLNICLLLITIFFNYRKLERLKRVIEIRIKNISDYKDAEFTYCNNGLTPEFTFLVSIQTITFFLSIVLIPFNITKKLNVEPEPLYIFLGFLLSAAYFFTLLICNKLFSSSELEKIKIDKRELDKAKILDFKNYFLLRPTEKTLYLNDELLINVTNTANDYKQRTETLLIESVFIGALTFGTFIQLTSPESISSISQIEQRENDSHGKIDGSNFKIKDLKLELRNENKIQESIKIKDSKINYEVNFRVKKNFKDGGHFTNWAIDRKLTIFSFYYNKMSNEETYKLLTGKFESKSKDSDDLLTTEKKYLETTIVSLLKDSIENKTINLVSSLSARLVFLNSLPLSYRDSNKNKIRRLLFRINQKRLSKYDSIKKISWDEQEYIFLIAIGSIICSVFYIAVLIKRYPIVISIEKLIAEINKAKIWNNREESMHFKKTELELELERMIRDGKNTPVEIIKTYDNKIDDYADRLQKQLATCEFIASNIETNIKIVSMFRSIGLGMFFTVVLISTLMIDSFLSIILLIIITYAIFIAEILNEQSIVIRFWRLLFKKHETNNIIFK